MLKDISINKVASKINIINIPYISIYSRQIIKSKKPFFEFQNELYKVEDFAQIFFERNNYYVFKGDDIHLFFCIASCNFKASFFKDVLYNYIGDNAKKLIKAISLELLGCIKKNHISENLIDLTNEILQSYYSIYPPKKQIFHEIYSKIKELENDELFKLIKFYKSFEYKTKGAPDLFIMKDAEYYFVEVKTKNDSLSADQFLYFEKYLMKVGASIFILKVLPNN